MGRLHNRGPVSPSSPRLVPGVLALCTVFFSACGGTTEPDPGGGLPPLQWTAPVVLFSGGGARLASNDAGQLYAVGKVSGSSNLHVRQSNDEGASWSTPVNTGIARDLLLYKSLAAVGSTLHMLTSLGDNANLIYSRSDDGGVTWPVQHDLSQNVEVHRAHRASIVVASSNVHVANSRQFNAPNRTVTYWRSTNGGNSFSAPVTIFNESNGGGVDPDLASGLGGVVHLVFSDWSGGNPFPPAYNPATGQGGVRALYFRSADNGATWPSPPQGIVLGNPLLRPRLAAAGGRVVVITETQPQPGETQELWQSRSTNDGASWGAATKITSTPMFNISHPVVAAGTSGQLHVAAFDDMNRRLLAVRSSDFGTAWSTPAVVASLAANGIDQPLSLVSAGGHVHMIAAAAFTQSAAAYMRARTGAQ